MRLREAVIAVTYRCNARCSMCNIWRNPPEDEMEPWHYAKLPTSLETINITGGEPFLRKDLVDVLLEIHNRSPRSRIVFSTNGLMTDVIVSVLSEVHEFHRRVGVGISIDGSEDKHDRIRGCKGAFNKALATIESLKDNGVRDLRVGMTISEDNVADVKEVYDLAKRLGVQFTTTFAHNSEIYFQKTDNPMPEEYGTSLASLDAVVRAYLLSRSPKDWFRAYHMRGITDQNLRREFISHCEAGTKFFFISPSGNVFPCSVMDFPLGNLKTAETWGDMLGDDVRVRLKEAVRSCRIDCWMVCNTRSLIMSHPFRVAYWIAINKALAVMRN